jgi:iron-sulfur cluster repair protein YtfE (RIC family)
MLFTVGSRAPTGDVVDLLVACHHRIREHLVLARRIATAPAGSPEESIRAAAARVRSYFGHAFPFHRADEEDDIFPLLVGHNDALDVAIGELVHDHEAHEAHVGRLVEICHAIEREPATVRVHTAELTTLVDTIEKELVEHLNLEERTVFPAIATLSWPEREGILARMRLRRAHLG